MLRAFLRSFAEDLVGMALVAGAILGIAAFLQWMPDDEPVLAGAGIVVFFVVLAIVSLRCVRRSSR